MSAWGLAGRERVVRIGVFIGVLAVPLLASRGALAQDLPDPVFAEQDAFQRPFVIDVFAPRVFPEQQVLGIPIGGVVLRPSIDVSAIANSNVRVEADGGGTLGVLIAPMASIRSTNPRYALNAYVGGTAVRYASRETENVEQVFGGISFRRPVGQTNSIAAEVEGGRYVEDRAVAFTPFDARTPIEFDRIQGKLTVLASPGRWVVNPGVEVLRLAYHDNRRASDPSQVLLQRTRSLVRTNPSLTLGYVVSGDTAVYVGAESNRREYDVDQTRDSRGYAVYVGGRIRLTNLVRIDAAAGYLRQNYRSTFTDPKARYLRVAVDWAPTPLTNVRFDLRRDIAEAGTLQRGGAVRTRTRLWLTHELYRNLPVTLGAETTASRFTDIQRTDRRSFLTAEARYLVGRQWEVFTIGEQLFSRSGDLPALAPDFDRTIVRVGMRLKR